jgi:hypothetical protein
VEFAPYGNFFKKLFDVEGEGCRKTVMGEDLTFTYNDPNKATIMTETVAR